VIERRIFLVGLGTLSLSETLYAWRAARIG
jgi:hypothetical protein